MYRTNSHWMQQLLHLSVGNLAHLGSASDIGFGLIFEWCCPGVAGELAPIVEAYEIADAYDQVSGNDEPDSLDRRDQFKCGSPDGSSVVCGCRRYRPAPSGRRFSSGCSTRTAARCASGIRDLSGNSAFPRCPTWTQGVSRWKRRFPGRTFRFASDIPEKQITQPVAGGIRRREFGWLKCQRLSRPCLQGGKMTTHERTKNRAVKTQPCFYSVSDNFLLIHCYPQTFR